jgi:1-acyl-sn-glycerol-3-phosphate acyltransferase
MTLLAAVRSLFTLVAGVVATIICSLASLLISALRPGSPMLERVIRIWGMVWIRAAGVRLIVEGADKVDPTRSYVVVGNHLSAYDIMVHLSALPVPVRFLAKAELFRIPLFAQAMRAVGMIEVDRKAGASIHKQVSRDARSAIAMGRSIIVYPEGTRARGGELASFKKGAFTIAVDNELAVLPVTIHGTQEVWQPGRRVINPGVVHLLISAPIEVNPGDPREAERLRDTSHAEIAANYERLRALVA